MMSKGKFWSAMKKLLGGNICGLNAKEGTVVAGLFTLISSIMHMIFEIGNLRYLVTVINATALEDEKKAFLQMFNFNCTLMITLIGVGIIAVFGLFLSVWREIFWGVGIYVVWIFLYEFGQLFLLIFEGHIHYHYLRAMKILHWAGLAMESIIQCYWLIFLIRHTIELYKVSRMAKDPSKLKRILPPKLKFGTVMEMGV
ncbi:transmembrane protein 217-like isoform X1 [Narcine bancroftii]|uniref:transmembrane protein 217-like isoform X1 n=1 Tax=Narcine bancroftii TaxID=1343680 RepID=UPI003831BE3E